MKARSVFLISTLLLGFNSASSTIPSTDLLNSTVSKKRTNTKTITEASNFALDEINSVSSSEYSIDGVTRVNDFDDNEYLYVKFYPFGYSIVSMDPIMTVECNPFARTKVDIESSYRYIPVNGFYEQEGTVYRNVLTRQSFDAESADEYKALAKETHASLITESSGRKLETLTDTGNVVLSSSGSDGQTASNLNIDIEKRVVTADVEVKHSWFFKYNTYQFPYSTPRTYEGESGSKEGICEYIAFILLMAYNDFFKAKGYFMEGVDLKYITPIIGTDIYHAIPNINDRFPYDLYVQFGKKTSLNCTDLNNLAKMVLEYKPIEYQVRYAYWKFGDSKKAIRNGRPEMICGYYPGDDGKEKGHNIVAYGYFTQGTYKGKYLAHYGWDGLTQCIVDKAVFKTGYTWSLEDKTPNPKDRYVFNVNGKLLCGKYYE